jgi:hypothetical protein
MEQHPPIFNSLAWAGRAQNITGSDYWSEREGRGNTSFCFRHGVRRHAGMQVQENSGESLQGREGQVQSLRTPIEICLGKCQPSY